MFNWGLAILLFLVLLWLSGQQTIDYLKANVESFVAEIKIDDGSDASGNNPEDAMKQQTDNNLLRGEPLSEIARIASDDTPDDYWIPFKEYVGVSNP